MSETTKKARAEFLEEVDQTQERYVRTLLGVIACDGLEQLSVPGKNLSALGECEKAIRAVLKVWGNQAEAEQYLNLLREQAYLTLNTPEGVNPERVTCPENLRAGLESDRTMELVMGLFYTAIDLDRQEERWILYNMASRLDEKHGLTAAGTLQK